MARVFRNWYVPRQYRFTRQFEDWPEEFVAYYGYLNTARSAVLGHAKFSPPSWRFRLRDRKTGKILLQRRGRAKPRTRVLN
jgi:hypothetical protein